MLTGGRESNPRGEVSEVFHVNRFGSWSPQAARPVKKMFHVNQSCCINSWLMICFT
ncbi:protein of unknown function [Hyphomicrobium sp. 1Nfss2.1]